jgi:hypothetical protein
VLMLERRGFLSRAPGQARSIRVLIPLEDLPHLEDRSGSSQKHSERVVAERERFGPAQRFEIPADPVKHC